MNIVVYPTAANVAAAAADLIASEIADGATTVGLAGGGTPQAAYELLPGRDIDWSGVTLWLSDERWVPVEHPDSNAGMAKATFVDATGAHLLLPRYEAHHPAAAASAYEDELFDAFGDGGHAGLVLLGIGDDGHTASLFPGTDALEIHEDPLFRLGNHSQTHTRFTLLDPEEVDIEVATASDRIREAIGDPCHAPRYFRFPFGSADCDSMGVVRSHGLAVASVHIDAGDWCYGANGGVCPESVIPWIPEEFRDDLPGYSVDQFLLKGGGVMLMHDVHANTAAELPAIIAGLQAAGASFVDLADPVLFPIMNGPIPAPEAPACCVAPMD